jgi:hypothetical protein
MPLTGSRNTPHKDAELLPFPVAGGAKIFGGAMVVINATGFAAPGSTSLTVTYVGRAEDNVDNTAGADGAKTVSVRRKKVFKWANFATDPVAQADVGKQVYIVDDFTVAKTNGTGTRSVAGKLMGVDLDGVWVEG